VSIKLSDVERQIAAFFRAPMEPEERAAREHVTDKGKRRDAAEHSCDYTDYSMRIGEMRL
jgi:hypothetical protein